MRVDTSYGFSGTTRTREVTLSCAVMHTPSRRERRECVSALFSDLGENKIRKHWHSLEVFGDFYRKGIWQNAKRCWEYGANAGATHHLVIQDDVRVCRDFVVGIFSVIAGFPDDIIGLYCNIPTPPADPPEDYLDLLPRWGTTLGPRGPAIIMPVDTVRRFLAWESENIKPSFKHDDLRITLYCDSENITSKLPLPNLVDHKVEFPSVGRNEKQPKGFNFMGERSPLDFNWLDKTGLSIVGGSRLSCRRAGLINA